METTETVADVDPLDEVRQIAERPGAAMVVDWSFHRYLSSTGFISRSALDDLATRGPAYMHARHIEKSIPWSTTPAMELGTQLHTRLLEPDDWARRVLIWEELPRPPGANGRAKAGTEAKRLYEIWKSNSESWSRQRDAALHNGGIVIDTARCKQVQAMASSILSHKFGSKLLRGDGQSEVTILWHHPDTGVLVRTRLDRIHHHSPTTSIIVDVKTTADPTPKAFAKSIVNFGYHVQGALYSDAARALWPDRRIRYVIAAVRSSPPYETAFYELTEQGPNGPGPLELGRDRYTRALFDYADRCDTNNWVADWQTGISKIELPSWAYRNDQ